MGFSKIKKIFSFVSMLILVVTFCWFRTPRTMGEAMGKFVMSEKIVITDGNTGQKITLNEEEREELFQILNGTRICGRQRYEPRSGYCKAIGLFCGHDSLFLIPRGDTIEVGYWIWEDVFILDDENNEKFRRFIGM